MSKHPLFLIVVFDALRPDMVTAELAPNLSNFIAAGCNFALSRAVFPTSTHPNAAALTTGATPRKNGIVSNRFFDPNVFSDQLLRPGLVEHIDAAQAVYGGRFYATPTLGELATAAGYKTAAITTGPAGTARPFDPKAREEGNINLCLKAWGASTPASLAEKVLSSYGPIPVAAVPNVEAIRLQTDILLDVIYPHYEPDLTLLWFSDPDQTYHYCGVGSPESAEAIRHVDIQFGRILEWWRHSALHDRLQIIAVSDHGHLTTIKRIDVNKEAAAAGLVIDEHFNAGAHYAGYTSYSGGVKVRDGDRRRRAALVEWLFEQPWCGVIFTKDGNGVEGGVPGTFDHTLALIDHPRAPDVCYVMLNDDGVGARGLRGRCYYNGKYPAGDGGTHGGLHPKELHNVMAFHGSLFKEAVTLSYPAGIIDVAPTIAHAMGFAWPLATDGRVLSEAMRVGAEPEEPSTVSRSVARGSRVQHLQYSQMGATIYLDAGWVE